MATKKVIEQWFPDGLPNAGNHGPIRVYFDPEANGGNGEVTYTDDSSNTLDPLTNRGVASYPVEFPSPPNPFTSSAGKKFILSKISGTPYAQAVEQAIECDLSNLDINVQPATDGNNGQISISVEGSNGKKEFSINGGADWSPSPVFSNLAPGDYEVVAADASRYCTLSETVTVANEIVELDDLKIISIDVQHSLAGQETGTITITAEGSFKPFEYALISPIGATFYQDSNIFTNLPADVYTVLVEDSEGNIRKQTNVIVLETGQDEPSEPLEPVRVTEKLSFEVREVACENPFPIIWLNHLGGWELWVFETNQTYEHEVERSNMYEPAYSNLQEIKNNISYKSLRGRQIVTVGANDLTQDQANGVASLIYSEKIYLIEKDEQGNWVPKIELIPDTNSLKKYETALNFQTIEITFFYPEEYL